MTTEEEIKHLKARLVELDVAKDHSEIHQRHYGRWEERDDVVAYLRRRAQDLGGSEALLVCADEIERGMAFGCARVQETP